MLPKLIATVFYVGYLRPGPGTWGSVAALPLGWGLHMLGGVSVFALATLGLFALGWWATQRMTRGAQDHDPSEIVIDEVVGQWIALLPLTYAASTRGIDILAMWPGWVAAFVLFRLFDITKPWLVGRADARGDALGVMLDDVIAGVFAAIGVIGLAAIAHGVY